MNDPERGVINAHECYSFDALMARMPEKTNREAIRKLVKQGRLPVRKIGGFSWFLGADVINAALDTGAKP